MSSSSVATWGLELILRWIRDAESKEERVHGLDAAMDAFDHYDEKEHDRELREGVAQTLTQVLALILSNDDDDEIDLMLGAEDKEAGDYVSKAELVCKALCILEMVHRCSATDLQNSFETFGGQLIPLLLEIFDNYSAKISSDKECEEGDWAYHAICNAVKILSYFSTVEKSMAIGIMWSHRYLLTSLGNVLSIEVENPEDEVNGIFVDVLNILSRCPRAEKLMNEPGLFDTVMSNIALNELTSCTTKEAAAHMLSSILKENSAMQRQILHSESFMADNLLKFLTLSMKDCRIEDEAVNWVRHSAARTAHYICIPVQNVDLLLDFNLPDNSSLHGFEVGNGDLSDLQLGSFVSGLAFMIESGIESFSAACGLCHLVGNSERTRELLSMKPSLLDIMCKMALINPNVHAAVDAVAQVLPYTSYNTFRKIVLLMTLPVSYPTCLTSSSSLSDQDDVTQTSSSDGSQGVDDTGKQGDESIRHMPLIQTAISAIISRVQNDQGMRSVMANDECIVMILSNATANLKSADRSEHANQVRKLVTSALHILSIDFETRLKLLDDPTIIVALVKTIEESQLNQSSVVSSFHEASANATCAICNLVVDDAASDSIINLLNREQIVRERKKHSKLWCICRWRKKCCVKLKGILSNEKCSSKEESRK